MNCVVCGDLISPERLELLPTTVVCTAHSTEQKILGCPAYGHKTGGGIIFVRPENKEGLRKLDNQYMRNR